MGEAGGLIKGMEWVEARVSDYKGMVRFYRDVLGLPIYFEEDDKDFIQLKAGESNTYIALLGTGRATSGYIPAFEVSDIRAFIKSLREKAVKSIGEIKEFGHIFLVEFSDPEGNRLQAFQWKGKRG